MDSRHTGYNSQNDKEYRVNSRFALLRTGVERMQFKEGTGWKACYDENYNELAPWADAHRRVMIQHSQE